jgi:hypothetical protein
VYVVTYALTAGIQVFRKGVVNHGAFRSGYTWVYSGRWFESLEDAKTAAEAIRVKKIASLQRQLDKLRNRVAPIVEMP